MVTLSGISRSGRAEIAFEPRPSPSLIMFGLFKKPLHQDPVLGTLQRASGIWKGTLKLPGGEEISIRLAGGREAPDADFLTLAHGFAGKFEEIKPQISAGLFEHYEPYKEAFDDGQMEEGVESFPNLTNADDILPHASIEYVFIGPLQGAPGKGPFVEVAYRVAWDEEHTVGVRFQDWQVFEVCGSV